MEKTNLRKTVFCSFAMVAAIAFCVQGGMKLSNFYIAENKKIASNGAIIKNEQPFNGQEITKAPSSSESPESAGFIEAGKKMGELYRDKENKVVAIVGGKYEIRENDIEIGLLLQEAFSNASNYDALEREKLSEELKHNALAGSQTKAKEEMLQELIKKYVLVGEAAKRGISATQVQARAYIDEQYALAEKVLSQASEKERAHALKTRSLLNALVLGTGMTNEEYLREIQLPGIVHQLMIEQLYKSFVDGLSEDVRVDSEQVKEEYKSFEQKLVDDADIIRFD